MDRTEAIVQKALQHMGFSNIVYEPNGNIPPDFLVNGQIAVEARRLNQNVISGNVRRGLEQDSIPLGRMVKRVAQSLGPPTQGKSWFLSYKYARPVESLKTLEPKIRKALQGFIASNSATRSTIKVSKNFWLEIDPAGKARPTFYVVAVVADQDSGGFLVAEVGKNLQLCIQEKTAKIAAHKAKYSEWWLMLPDYIGHALDSYDRDQFRKEISIQHSWDKVILIDPYDPSNVLKL